MAADVEEKLEGGDYGQGLDRCADAEIKTLS